MVRLKISVLITAPETVGAAHLTLASQHQSMESAIFMIQMSKALWTTVTPRSDDTLSSVLFHPEPFKLALLTVKIDTH